MKQLIGLNEITLWLSVYKLSLNTNKTRFIIFKTKDNEGYIIIIIIIIINVI